MVVGSRAFRKQTHGTLHPQYRTSLLLQVDVRGEASLVVKLTNNSWFNPRHDADASGIIKRDVLAVSFMQNDQHIKDMQITTYVEPPPDQDLGLYSAGP